MANDCLQRGWEARVPKAWKFTRFGTVQDMFLHFLCLVLGNCFWENVGTLLGGCQKLVKLQVLRYFPSFFFPRGQFVGTFLQIIVK